MPRKTNRAIYAELKDQIDAKKKVFLKDVTQRIGGCPSKVYEVIGRLDNHRVREIEVTYMSCLPVVTYQENPKRSEIDWLRKELENFAPKSSDIYLATRGKLGDHCWTSSLRYDECGDRWHHTAEEAQEVADVANAEYAIREGQVRCAYCEMAVDADKAVTYTVFARQYPNGRKVSKYCSKECGAHDQMAHEG